ncbi:type II toxin-antitoxin system VapC family toxin [Halomicrobium sp. HM KBTZ05]|uniref:type II toxin-antitoxin system VapC family toxin n=1 Tax=Halomicrobium sp. HM KBTZ05 TaxID=3242663 RepID=UPI0035583E5B
MSETIPRGVKILTDVNVLAIGLTDDHPAHEYVWPWIRDALDGPNVLLIFDYYPFRAQYIMTRQFGVSETDARNAVQSLVQSPARLVGASEGTILDAYEVSAEQNHDVYDSFIVALAREHDADYLVTTDTDFVDLCADEAVEYTNPVPEDELDVLSLTDG